MIAETTDFKEAKFALFHKISRMLRDAPHPVRRAWNDGWTDIRFYPDGYDSPDYCCGSTRYPAGWYGECPVAVQIGNTLVTGTSVWQYFCGPSGKRPQDMPAPISDTGV